MLQSVVQAFHQFRPRRRWWRHWVKRSAVAIIVCQRDNQLQLMMIRRAERVGDPWSGHMAFPGGRMDPGDRLGRRTAIRETREEVGICLEQAGHCIGRLSDIVSRPHSGRRPMVVTPYVFQLPVPVVPQPDHTEVAEVVWVPLSFLQEPANREMRQFQRGTLTVTLPSYRYRDNIIWGMSLRMLDELLGLLEPA